MWFESDLKELDINTSLIRTKIPNILEQHILLCDNIEKYYYKKEQKIENEDYIISCIEFITDKISQHEFINLFPENESRNSEITQMLLHYFTEEEIKIIQEVCLDIENKRNIELSKYLYTVITAIAHLIWFSLIEYFWYVHKKTILTEGVIDTINLDDNMVEQLEIKNCGECQPDEDYDEFRGDPYSEDQEMFDSPGRYFPYIEIDSTKMYAIGFDKFPKFYEQIQIDMMAPPEINKYGINIETSIPEVKFLEAFHNESSREDEKPFQESFTKYIENYYL